MDLKPPAFKVNTFAHLRGRVVVLQILLQQRGQVLVTGNVIHRFVPCSRAGDIPLVPAFPDGKAGAHLRGVGSVLEILLQLCCFHQLVDLKQLCVVLEL